MYEIKKIHSQSLANYLALISSITVFLFGLINFSINILNVATRSYWRDLLVSWFISVIVFYVIAWIIGYLFSIIYNFFSARIRGIIIDVESLELKDGVEQKTTKKEEF
ncbi:MAG: hypothetical protein PHH83_01630 [Patescibacteria group bacterium]|nr:hypothetical protein [Patescibacteria group bacterium]